MENKLSKKIKIIFFLRDCKTIITFSKNIESFPLRTSVSTVMSFQNELE